MYIPEPITKTCTNPGCSVQATRDSHYCEYHLSRRMKSIAGDVVLVGLFAIVTGMLIHAYLPL